jgi:two-component system alkaline phosphatase synthesis response regulator PhoP
MKTILIIDDEPAILEVLSAVLEDEGYSPLTAANGQEGLARLADRLPDLVLCDVMMPIMDGREVCRAMQNNARYRSVPIVLMSAANSALSNEECPQAFLLSKPFELDEILDLVQRLVNQ